MLKQEDCKDIKLLYVEDDKKASEATVRIFEKFFNNITVAYDGQEGLDLIKTDQYDLLITDVNMPKLNGLDMIAEAKKIKKDIYTIVLTAYSDQKTFLGSVRLGVKGYIIKPMVMEQFAEVLETAVSNINAQKQINILEQYKEIVDHNSIVSKTDIKGKITFVNDKFCELSGYARDELIGKNHNIVRHPDMEKTAFENLWHTIQNKRIWTGQVKNRKKDGSSYYVDATICPIIDVNGDIVEYIGLRNDITDMINPKRQLIDIIKSNSNPFLTMLKIENFTTLEHIYGDKIIDNMLEIFKNMIYTYLPEGLENINHIFNLGDGEFALLQLNIEKKDLVASAKEIQLKQLQQNIHTGIIVVDEYEFDLSVFISFSTSKEFIYENTKYGLSLAQETQTNIVFANDLIKEAKKIAVDNSKTIKMIQIALKENKIISYFQPITNNKTNEVEKYESLVRLIDQNGKILSPYFFLEVAKQSGYYNKITAVVIKNSFDALEKTTKEISINLSAIDIEDLETRNMLINLVTTNMHNAHRIVFELLEDEHVKDFEVVKDFISLVKTFGCQIAIDDFGAGVSNFERLLDYQPDILKIDACLIKNIDKDKYSRDVVETIQLFAWKQDIKTVAEFVETPEILQTVKDIGINYTQGYLLGKPDLLENYQ